MYGWQFFETVSKTISAPETPGNPVWELRQVQANEVSGGGVHSNFI